LSKLRIGGVRLQASTPSGVYGRDIAFQPGLNIIHADNSLGKSTIVNAILFGLGLEGACTPEHTPPLPGSMTRELITGSGPVPVTSSVVVLEIGNAGGQFLTIERRIENAKGSTLVSTWLGRGITSQRTGPQRDFLVRVPGAAQHESGFHKFLADFLGLQLPLVERFDKPPTILYLELLVPFFFVEQKLGWSGIVKINSSMGIRRAFQHSFEFLAGLDTSSIRIQRHQFSEQLAHAVAEWRANRESAESLGRSVNAVISGLPNMPSIDELETTVPSLVFPRATASIPIEKEIERLHAKVREIRLTDTESVGAVVEPRRIELAAKTDTLSKVELESQETSIALARDESELEAASRRLVTIEADLSRYKGLLRLQERGSAAPIPIEIKSCPTCSQEMHDNLLPQDSSFVSLSIEQNAKVLADQRASLQMIRETLRERARLRTQQLRSIQDRADRLRAEIRSLKELLVSDPRAPAIDKLRERVRAEEEIRKLKSVKDSFDTIAVTLHEIAERYGDIQRKVSALPEGEFSHDDQAKLKSLQTSMREQLREYGFGSFEPEAIEVSWDTYRAVTEGSDITWRVSASDMVRTNWAYLVGLLELSRTHKTNLPGVLVLDEPSQQNARPGSVIALVRRLSSVKEHDQQVILATSESPSTWAGLEPGIDYSLFELKERLLQPITSLKP